MFDIRSKPLGNFWNATPKQQAKNFAREVAAAVEMKLSAPNKWQALQEAALSERFGWDLSADAYLSKVYRFDDSRT